MSRSDLSLIWVPSDCWSPPTREVALNTPGGEVYPRSRRSSVEITDVLTSPCGWPTAPVSPAIGVSERRVQGEPTKRSRAIANRATRSGCPASGGATTVTRRCCARRSVGVFSTALGCRMGTR